MKLTFDKTSSYPCGAYGEDKPIMRDEEVVAMVANRGNEKDAVELATLLAAAPELEGALRDVRTRIVEAHRLGVPLKEIGQSYDFILGTIDTALRKANAS